MDRLQYDGPVVLAILDGVGLAPDGPGNAVSKARTPFLGRAAQEYLHVALDASGEAVGLTPGQMGNSEVGHNTMGAGRACKQGIARINEAFESGAVFASEAWKGAMARVLGGADFDAMNGDFAGSDEKGLDKNDKVCYTGDKVFRQKTLHFGGIFSDGGVHSDIAHLEQMIAEAYHEGVRRMRIHAVFDGRDVGPTSEPKYIRRLESFVRQFADADIRVASGGGRMTTVADRYEKDWQVVKRGFDMMVWGEAEYYFPSAEEAISRLRQDLPGVQDQDLPAFVVVDDDGVPVGRICDGDALIYFDFRADRAIEIAQAFTYWDFLHFSRRDYTPDWVYFVGMTEYNSDTHVPEHRLVEPMEFCETLHEVLGAAGVSQLAISETVKFGHVTYYFNGNSYEKAEHEEFVEIKSCEGDFAERPWMRSAEITDEVIARMADFKFVRLNFPGGDMVGHTADFEATVVAMEAIDLSLKRLAARVDEMGGAMIIVADHGNAEELLDNSGAAKTAHTTNLVPCVIYDNTANRERYVLSGVAQPGLANLAATVATMLGVDCPQEWAAPLIRCFGGANSTSLR